MTTRADRGSRLTRTRPAAPRSVPRPRNGGAGGSGGRARRGSVLLVAVLVAVVALGAVRSVGPWSDLRAARTELAAMEAQVALLEEENAVVRSEIGRLGQDGYVEALARSELNLARPGEDVFVVQGLAGTTTTTAPVASAEAPEPGPLEKVISSFRRLF